MPTTEDKLPLPPDKQQAIELKHDLVTGQEPVTWKRGLAVPAKEFHLNQAEIAGLRSCP